MRDRQHKYNQTPIGHPLPIYALLTKIQHAVHEDRIMSAKS